MKPLLVLLLVTAFVAGAVSKKHRKKDACRYKKGPNKWTECVDGKMSMTKIRTEEAGNHCAPTMLIVRPCVPGCRYKFKGKFTRCGKGVETKSRVVTLKKQLKNAEGTCPKTLNEIRKCRVKCSYKKTKWGKCDKASNTQTKIKLLDEEKNMGINCQPEKVRTRECKKRKGKRKGKGKKRKNRGRKDDI